MSLNINKVVLGGRLTADPELKQTPNGVSVTSFTIAVDRNFRGKSDSGPSADFISVVAWRQTAEFITRYFSKGSPICVAGSIQTRTWQDQNGNKRYATEVVADEAYFVEGKAANSGAQADQAPAPTSKPANLEPLNTDDDLPF